jgi:hypothetical protein
MLAAAPGEFGGTPTEDDQAAFQTVCGHVSIMNTSGWFWNGSNLGEAD